MFDPFLTLTFNLHSNPGVTALLLGSGVSRSAGIPTGYEVILDLIRQVAQAEGVEPLPADLWAWYSETYGKDPDYSEILEELGKTPSERQAILRSYFEPTEGEREEGKKSPTQAHQAIARLVAKGYIRVILTTNFDRLLEKALEAEGVHPIVISTDDGILGALPLVHAACTIIKLHGDYLDARIKNTLGELEVYSEAQNKLLDRILDEYGLVICGWSGDWDNALRAAMERCSTRRFSTYWTVRGTLSDRAAPLATLRGAHVLQITGADPFFVQLRDRVEALEDLQGANPLSVKVAAAMLKRFIVDERSRIKLEDMIHDETERVHGIITHSSFDTFDEAHRKSRSERLQTYKNELLLLRALLVEGMAWGRQEHNRLWLNVILRLARDWEHGQSGDMALIRMRRLPALQLVYATGLAAMARNRFDYIRDLFALRIRDREERTELPLVLALANYYTHEAPATDFLGASLREDLRRHVPDDSDYDMLFNRFEYLLAVFVEYWKLGGKGIIGVVPRFLAPPHRFTMPGAKRMIEVMRGEVDAKGLEWEPLKAGVFECDITKLREILDALDHRYRSWS